MEDDETHLLDDGQENADDELDRASFSTVSIMVSGNRKTSLDKLWNDLCRGVEDTGVEPPRVRVDTVERISDVPERVPFYVTLPTEHAQSIVRAFDEKPLEGGGEMKVVDNRVLDGEMLEHFRSLVRQSLKRWNAAAD